MLLSSFTIDTVGPLPPFSRNSNSLASEQCELVSSMLPDCIEGYIVIVGGFSLEYNRKFQQIELQNECRLCGCLLLVSGLDRSENLENSLQRCVR